MAQEGETLANCANGLGDHTLGMYILSGVLAALYNRTKTGRGELVEASLYQAAIYSVSSMILMAQLGIKFPANRKRSYNPLTSIYECKDGKWLILAGTDYYSSLEKFATLTDLPILLENEDYNSPLGYVFCSEAITAIIQKRILEKTRDEWNEIFEKGDFSCENLQHISEVLEDKQAWENGYLRKVTYPSGNSGIIPGIPVSFKDHPVPEFKHPQRVGGDTVEVLKSIGYSDKKIGDLLSNGVIAD